MTLDKAARENIESASNEKLIEMLDSPGSYLAEALTLAQEVVAARGGTEEVRRQVEEKKEIEGREAARHEEMEREETARLAQEKQHLHTARAQEEQRKRAARPPMPGCLVAWLIIGIILNSIFGLFLFAMGEPQNHNPNQGLLFVGGLVCIAAVVCAIAVLRWRMWGVVGFCICNGIGAAISVAVGKNPISALGGIVAILIFLALINSGKDKPIQYMK